MLVTLILLQSVIDFIHCFDLFPKKKKFHLETILQFNPWTPESDQLLISPYNITLESNIKVTRKEEMITN